jgi:hypothetical protein
MLAAGKYVAEINVDLAGLCPRVLAPNTIGCCPQTRVEARGIYHVNAIWPRVASGNTIGTRYRYKSLLVCVCVARFFGRREDNFHFPIRARYAS